MISTGTFVKILKLMQNALEKHKDSTREEIITFMTFAPQVVNSSDKNGVKVPGRI